MFESCSHFPSHLQRVLQPGLTDDLMDTGWKSRNEVVMGGQVEMIRKLAAGDQEGRKQKRTGEWPHPSMTNKGDKEGGGMEET